MKKPFNIILIFTLAGFLNLQAEAFLPETYSEINSNADYHKELVVQIEKDQEEPLFEEFQIAQDPFTLSGAATLFLQGLIRGAASRAGTLIVNKAFNSDNPQVDPTTYQLFLESLEKKGGIIRYRSFEEMPPLIEHVIRDRFGNDYFENNPEASIGYSPYALSEDPMAFFEATGESVNTYIDFYNTGDWVEVDQNYEPTGITSETHEDGEWIE